MWQRHVCCTSRDLANIAVELLANARVVRAKKVDAISFETARALVTKPMKSVKQNKIKHHDYCD